MRRDLLTSPTATRVAFVVIILFVTAQMTWWIYFQVGYVGEVNAATIASLERESRVIDALLAAGATDQALTLLEDQPNLRLDASGRATEVDQAALDAFLASQRSVVRMLAFEGPFFVLVVMTGLLIIARNLRLERELKQRQRNFLDAVGHEYKTPISTLRLLIETLQLRSVPPEKLQEYLRSMSLEVDRLERTGQQVLATARLEAGAQQYAPPPTDLTRLVRTVIDRSRLVLAERGAVVELDVPDAPLPVRAGLDDVATILENLVDNAVKYTPEREKRVRVRLEGDDSWARLRVQDAGSGIPAAARAKVFDRFYRAGDELTRTTAGLGLGLYLVQRTAEALGGHVSITTPAEGGTLVTVTLRLARGSASEPEGEAAA